MTVDKEYFTSTRDFKLFGIKICEWTYHSSEFKGSGEFINTAIPDKEYFEHEFRKEKR